MTSLSKNYSLVKSGVSGRMKKEKGDDSCSSMSMGAEVDEPISDVELLRIMECPVCNEFPAPPIYSCEKGHFTCNSCISLLEGCSLCQASFTKVRNFALESIIENSKFKCRNAQLGCELTVTGAELNQHVVDCLYRPLECHEADCLKNNLAPNEYLQHIVHDHAVSGHKMELIDGKVVVNIKQDEDGVDSPCYILVESSEHNDKCTFLLFSKRYRTFRCWWVVCLEPQRLSEYEVSLSLSSKANMENMSVHWKLPIQPIWKDFDEIRDTGRCAVLPDTHLFPYIENSSWNLEVEFTKKDYICTNVQHYYPLLLLIIVGLVAVISSMFIESGLGWIYSMKSMIKNSGPNQSFPNARDAMNQQDFAEEYIGYRGFYYKAA